MINQRINIIKSLRRKFPQHSTILKVSTSSKPTINDVFSKPDSNLLKKWHEINTKFENSLCPESTKSLFVNFIQNKINPWTMTSYLKEQVLLSHKNLQRVNPVLEEAVGFEISPAYFLIFQGGKIKFKGQNKWIALNKDLISADLPRVYDPNYIISEIDASNIEIYYEGLLNFRNAQRIKRAIFKNSPTFDDWYIDRLSSYFPFLEYFDISDCPKVTEKGLEALYKCSDLKTLIVTNYSKTAAFELTCLMLEDCIPGLKVEILEPKGTKYNAHKN